MKAIVVLGQSLDPDGSAPGTLVRRVETAAELQLANPDDTLCVPTGGDPAQTGVTEAEVMRRLLVELEVPESAIRPEPRAQNTLQNAAHVLPILQSRGIQHILLVTSDFHMPRARYVFEAVFAYMAPSQPITIQPVTVGGGCASPGLSINSLGVRGRLQMELRMVRERLVQSNLKTCIPGMVIPPLPEARWLQVVAQLNEMLSKQG